MGEYRSYDDYQSPIDPRSPFFLDHVSRYWWVSELARGRSVLDCACGQGYGSYILSKTASSVLGIDLNTRTLEAARDVFQAPNLEFREYDALKLSSIGRKFDLVTAFEMVEHIPPASTDLFLGSFASALAPGGRLILSTPNHDVVLKSGSFVPEFHINNFRAAELRAALGKHFRRVEMLGQFRRKPGLTGWIFDLDHLNLRHLPGGIVRRLRKALSAGSGSSAHSGAQSERKATKLERIHYEKPYPGCENYLFSSRHWRQAGLSVAVCSQD